MKIQTVRITSGVRQKYVLVQVIDGNTESLIIWGNPDVEWHKDIVEEIKNDGRDVLEVLGGGWLLPDPEKESTYVWGKSDRFGEAPINLVKEVLKCLVIVKAPE